MLQQIEWVCATCLAFINAWILGRRMKGFLYTEDRLMFYAITGVGILVTTLLSLGLAGLFYPVYALMSQIAVLAAILALCKRRTINDSKNPTEGGTEIRGAEPWYMIGMLIAVVCVLGLLKACLESAPQSDSAVHHIPIARWYFEHHKVAFVNVGNTSLYPACISVIYAWIMFLSTSYAFTGLVSVMSAVIIGLGGAAICRLFGCNSRMSVWAFALILSNYVLFYEVKALYVDNAFAAFVVSGCAFALMYVKSKAPAHILGSGIAVGLAAASKPQGIVYGGLIFLMLLAGMLVNFDWQRIRKGVAPVLVWGGAVIAVAGYWYIRNALLSGNIAQLPDNGGSGGLRSTMLLWNTGELVRSFGVMHLLKSFSGQLSVATVFSFVPYIWLWFRVLSRSEPGETRFIKILFLCFAGAAFGVLMVHPFSARVGIGYPLNPDVVQLRYGIVAMAMMSMCWVVALADYPKYLPLLSVGLALPGSKIVFVVGLAIVGAVFACGNTKMMSRQPDNRSSGD